MLVRTTLVALVVLFVAAAAERAPTAADRPVSDELAAAGGPAAVGTRERPTSGTAGAATPSPPTTVADLAEAVARSRCLAGLAFGPVAAPALAPVADGAPADGAGVDARDPHPAGADDGTAGADARDPYPVAAQPAAAGRATAAPAADDQPAPMAADGTAATIPATAADAVGPDAPLAAHGGDAAAAAPDDLGTVSRRIDGFPHPLPVARPDDAVMRVALARIVEPGDVPATEATLPTARIGQMLMVGFEGDEATDPGPRRLAAHIRAGRVGGVLFFKRNVKSAAAVKALTDLFQDAAAAAPGGLPLFIAVDQEGGLVQRLDPSVGFPATPSAATLAAAGETAASAAYATLADNLAAWGFNLNLGPVVDLGFNAANPVVTRLGRTFAPDPATVTRFAELFIVAHRAAGVLTAIKHFPGHGSSNSDTHRGFVDVTASFRPEEILPFERLIEAGDAAMVMVAHVENGRLDPEKRPATLSAAVIDDVLRRRCGYGGVVITDDMEMAAIAALAGSEDVTAEAIGAGNDILVYGSGVARGADLVALLHARIRIAAQDPTILRRVEESAARIARLKETLRAPAEGR